MNPKARMALSVGVLIAAVGFALYQYRSATAARVAPTPAAGTTATVALRPGPPSPEELRSMSPEARLKMREQMFSELHLTEEQRKQFEALDKKYGPPGEGDMIARMQEGRKILTPEQQAAAREKMQSRMRAMMMERASVLPPDQREKFMDKLDARMEEMRRRIESGEMPDGPPPAP